MLLRKFGALFLIVVIISTIFTLYSFYQLTYSRNVDANDKSYKWAEIEKRVLKLEELIREQSKANVDVAEEEKIILNDKRPDFSKRTTSWRKPLFCPHFQTSVLPRHDIQMLERYKLMDFTVKDGGVWKQGWEITVDEKEWNSRNKLKVFVVPHSHNDPGWIKTVDEYYVAQTKHILNNMLTKLAADHRRKFIWAEISYFSMWWSELEDSHQTTVRQLVRDKQLEIVTGGWVMNDEANAHFLSIVHQMTEGHQWLYLNLNYTPSSGWAIDPFGMSALQPFLLKKMGFKQMLIHRVHYSVKKQLARNRELEFRWRQFWDSDPNTDDILTHMMPFYSYDIPHTCGPDPKICCQFDFRRLPGFGMSCPWKIPPVRISDSNVAERAHMLLDQYRKKSKLYKTNVVLIPLGDDFRYDHPKEWDEQFENYQKLFDYMNSNLNLNVIAKFGTLSEYFEEILKERKLSSFPTLSGDFFTYADRGDHYWSGFYTSRPFYKRMDRVLLGHIRAAEVALFLSHLTPNFNKKWFSDVRSGFETGLATAREALALFQHHDAITGTARHHVVQDYGQRMWKAIQACQALIQYAVHLCLSTKFSNLDAALPSSQIMFYNMDELRYNYNELPTRFQVTLGTHGSLQKLVLFNSLPVNRLELIHLEISTPYVEVISGHQGAPVLCQISPVFEHSTSISHSKYVLSFVVKVDALGMTLYTIRALSKTKVASETIGANIKVYNVNAMIVPPEFFDEHIYTSRLSTEFSVQTSDGSMVVSFTKSGLLKSINFPQDFIKPTGMATHLEFMRYGAKASNERSGAYLFLPDGPGIVHKAKNTIVNIIEGQLFSSVSVQLPYVRHTVTVQRVALSSALDHSIRVDNVVDIRKTNNFELAMRISSQIRNGVDFFTDMNAYSMIRRKHFEKLPLQANVYPMPGMAYIEDELWRLSIVSSGPLGVLSSNEGELEIMLDRRLDQDDNLGMGEPVHDNVLVHHTFHVLLEHRTDNCKSDVVPDHPGGFPTIAAHMTHQILSNPILKLFPNDEEFDHGKSDDALLPRFSYPDHKLAANMDMPSIRMNINGISNHVGILFRRIHFERCYASIRQLREFPVDEFGIVDFKKIFRQTLKNVKKATLSFLQADDTVLRDTKYELCPMDIAAFIVTMT